jgi:hypothetical protein
MPTYTIQFISYQDYGTPVVSATITQTIDGKTWAMSKSCSGATATEIWNKLLTGDIQGVIALILALP